MERGMSVQLRRFRVTTVHGLQIFSISHHSGSPLQPVILGCTVTGSTAHRTSRHCAIWRSVQVGAEPQRIGPKRMGCRDGTTAGREWTRSTLCDFHQNASDSECGLQSCRGRVSVGGGRILSRSCSQSARNTSECLWAERVDLTPSLNRKACRWKFLRSGNPQEAHLLAAIRRDSTSTASGCLMCSEQGKGALN